MLPIQTKIAMSIIYYCYVECKFLQRSMVLNMYPLELNEHQCVSKRERNLNVMHVVYFYLKMDLIFITSINENLAQSTCIKP